MALLTSGLKMTKTTEKNLESNTLKQGKGSFTFMWAKTLIFREG